MSAKPILQPLGELPGVCEILGLGRVRENPNGGTEPLIEALFATDIFKRKAEPKTVTKWLGVGQMNLLIHGYRFTKGRKSDGAPVMRYKGKLSPLKEPDRETLGTGIFQKTAAKATTARLDAAPGWLLRHEGNSLGDEPDEPSPPKIVFLPKTELIRAVFGGSSDFLKQVIDGRRDPTVAPSRFAFDRDRCFVDDAKRVKLSVNRKISAEDAHILAAIFADGSGQLLRFHDMVHQNLITDPAFRTNVGAYLQADWPWPDGVEMVFSGRWISRAQGAAKTSNRFVITRIETIAFPSPPSAIEVLYPSETKAEKGMPQPSGRTILAAAGPRQLRSDRVPDRGRLQESMETEGTVFPFTEALKIEWSPGDIFYGRKDVGLRGDQNAGERFLSTDDARSGGDPATGQGKIVGTRRVEGNQELDRESSLARKRTWEALEKLAARNGWVVEYWRQDRGKVETLPYQPAATDADAPFVATVVTKWGLKAVADLGSATGDPASIGVVSASQRKSTELLATDVFEIAGSNRWKWLARKNRARSHNFTQVIGHSRSRQCWKERGYYADKLEEWLR